MKGFCLEQRLDIKQIIELDNFVKQKGIKVPTINIQKGAKATTVARRDVAPGQVFALKNREGKLGTNYAHVGMNSDTGRMYSVNLKTGELSSSTNGDRQVQLTGTFQYVINNTPAPSVVRECRRSDVKSGEAFHVKGKEVLYAHLGAIALDSNGWLSVPLARTENHGVARKGNSRVNVVATFTMDVSLVA